jgi:hypothetical protein
LYGTLAEQQAYNGDEARTSKTVAGDTTEYALDLLATLPVVISDTDADEPRGTVRRGAPEAVNATVLGG